MKLVVVLCLTLLQVSITIAYNLLEDFSGNTFFNTWDFYGNYDNLTLGTLHEPLYHRTRDPLAFSIPTDVLLVLLGDVWWLTREQAFEQGLVSINAEGNAIIKVDNSTEVLPNEKRNTVRLFSSLTCHCPKSFGHNGTTFGIA